MKLRATSSVFVFLACVVLTTFTTTSLVAQNWPSFGHDPTNNASGTGKISTKNVQTLAPKWVFTTGGDVSAHAAVVNGVVYFPDWAGNIYAVNANNGSVIWSHQLSDYGLAAGTVSRTSPAVLSGVLYIGTQYNASGPTGWLLAINASTGALKWKVRPDTSNAFPVITASPVVVKGVVYVGMTSNEEFVAANPAYPCCSVVGSLVAIKATNGSKLWQTFMAPTGYAGANIWGSHPVVDTARNTVFVGTGNNYSIPTAPAYTRCIENGGTEITCVDPNDHADSILALDMTTGNIKWATKLMNWNQYGITNDIDFWNVGCVFPPYTNCPAAPTGPDYDFGSGPNEVTYESESGPVTILGAGQKSGIYYALNPDTGALIWSTQVGPGSSLGGIEWGSASDGQLIYVAISNLYGIPYAAGSAGSWAALDPATGKIVWQVSDPNGAVDLGPLAVSKGVVYAPSMAGSPTAPTMVALSAATGDTLWTYPASASVVAGATLANNMVYWGSGYAHLGIPGFTGGNNQFYAFSLNGQ